MGEATRLVWLPTIYVMLITLGRMHEECEWHPLRKKRKIKIVK
jgi:hypothetical protein